MCLGKLGLMPHLPFHKDNHGQIENGQSELITVVNRMMANQNAGNTGKIFATKTASPTYTGQASH